MPNGNAGSLRVSHILEHVIDTYEKLEIAMYLFGTRFQARSTKTIADALSLSVPRTRDAISALSAAGVVRALDPYGSGWWISSHGKWALGLEELARLYAVSRAQVIELVSRRAFVASRRND